MLGRVRLYDYRCFWREQPATLELKGGFTSFIGPNNSGKSSLVKVLYELRSVFDWFSGNRGSIGGGLQQTVGWNVLPPANDHAEIITERVSPLCAVELEPQLPPGQQGQELISLRIEFSENGQQVRFKFLNDARLEIGVPGTPTGFTDNSPDFVRVREIQYDARSLFEFVETLRKVQYFGPFRNAINEGAGSHFDTQIGTGFISQWHQWKVGASKEQNRAIRRVTEDVRRLIGANSLEINASIELKTLQLVVDGRPQKLQELGAGLSQLVLVLGNALIRRPSFILIDEPELHLHPALQSEFLTTLATYSRFGVLYATHSIGLARLADSCFTVQRLQERSVVRSFERTPHYAEFLGSLGIAGLQEMGWDRVLLVEGPKDVRTLQQLLRLYGRDRQTIVMPLGGDSMVNGNVAHELSEVRRLCDRVFAIVDSECNSETSGPVNARTRFGEICGGLGIACCITQRRAIENYISQKALDQVWGAGAYTALGPYDAPGAHGLFWGKGESWKAAAKMTRQEIASTDLGRLLEAI